MKEAGRRTERRRKFIVNEKGGKDAGRSIEEES
jgi:hypothetical protein